MYVLYTLETIGWYYIDVMQEGHHMQLLLS